MEIGAKMMDDGIRDNIIDDLLRKTPRNTYSDSMLFKLGLHTSFDIETYICNRFFGGKIKSFLKRQKGTVTRRFNRLHSRIMPAVRHIQVTGDKGIYRIVDSSFNLLGYVYAESCKEAKRLGEMFLSYSSNDEKPMHTRFASYSFPRNLISYNAAFIDKLDKKINAHNQIINATKKKIEKSTALKASLLLMQKHILISEK